MADEKHQDLGAIGSRQVEARVQNKDDPYAFLTENEKSVIELAARPKQRPLSDEQLGILKDAYASKVAAAGWRELGRNDYAEEFEAQEKDLLKKVKELGDH